MKKTKQQLIEAKVERELKKLFKPRKRLVCFRSCGVSGILEVDEVVHTHLELVNYLIKHKTKKKLTILFDELI